MCDPDDKSNNDYSFKSPVDPSDFIIAKKLLIKPATTSRRDPRWILRRSFVIGRGFTTIMFVMYS